MTAHYFFGYGSLVNDRTHRYPLAQPARLAGWRRVWCHTGQRAEAFLSVHPAPGAQIEGLVAAVPDRDWAALDAREAGYDRHEVTAQVSHGISGPAQVQVYAIPRHTQSPGPAPILLSYLDVVVQGFLSRYGLEGAHAFFATTDGWDRPITDDRARPRYPRHQRLTEAERGFVDARVAELGVTVVPADWA